MKRGLREHLENQETGETGCVGSPGVFSLFTGLSAVLQEKKKRLDIPQICSWDHGPDVHCKFPEIVFLLQGSRGIQGPQGAVGKKGENVSAAIHLVVGK